MMHGHTVVSRPPTGKPGPVTCECGETFDSPGHWADHYRAVTPREPSWDDDGPVWTRALLAEFTDWLFGREDLSVRLVREFLEQRTRPAQSGATS